jgi:hypothetical protein
LLKLQGGGGIDILDSGKLELYDDDNRARLSIGEDMLTGAFRFETTERDIVLSPATTYDIMLGKGGGGPTGAEVDVRLPRGSLCIDGDGGCTPPATKGHIKALMYATAGPSDIAEVYASGERLEPGDVIVIDAEAEGRVRRSRSASERGILSVVSTRPGLLLGAPSDEDLALLAGAAREAGPFAELDLLPETYPVVLTGRTAVKVVTENGRIASGDLLTSSSTPGVAMRATRPGPVLGQALGSFAGPGQGIVTAWVFPGSSGHTGSGATGAQGVAGPHRATEIETVTTPAAGLLPVDAAGHAHADSFRPESPALATAVEVSEAVEPGDVLVVDPVEPGRMRPGNVAADPAVIGVVAGESGLLLGGGAKALEPPGENGAAAVAVAFSGIVHCKVDAGYGAIAVGDLLTTSPTRGHAMLADEPRAGTIVGKALEPLEFGTGLIRILVMLR